MNDQRLDVREACMEDIPHIVSYWTDSPEDYLVSLGVDLAKRP